MKPISRRKLLTGGLAATAGVAGLTVAARMAERYGLIPPDCGGVYGPGDDADLCRPTDSDSALARAGVSAKHDFEVAFRQFMSAADGSL